MALAKDTKNNVSLFIIENKLVPDNDMEKNPNVIINYTLPGSSAVIARFCQGQDLYEMDAILG